MAELFHGSVPRHPTGKRAVPDHLPGLSRFDAQETAHLRLNQLENAFEDLLGDRNSLSDAVTAVKTALASDPIRGDQVRSAIAELHQDALASLTIADFRLGKAYGLGRALAETVLLPLGADDDSCPTQYRLKFNSGRLSNLYQWLADLKTALPDHSSYAVDWSLRQWEQWTTDKSDADLIAADGCLRRQGQQWRALLSGERAGTDFLGTIDLIDAAKGLSSRLGRVVGAFASRYSGTIVAVVIAIVAVVGGVVAISVTTGDEKVLWAALTALIGVVGGAKGVSATLGKGIQTVEPALWQSELDAAVANKILVLPVSVPRPAADLSMMGTLGADTTQGLVDSGSSVGTNP